VDADARVLGLVKKTSITVNGDAREAALALAARLKTRQLASAANRDERMAAVKGEKETWAKELAGWDHETDAWSLEVAKGSKYMHPRQMLRELAKAMPEDAMVSTDIGNICQVANSYLRFNQPRSMFGAMMFGNCGYAFPTMIGCKVGAPDRTAIAYVGDGAWGMSLAEVMTAVKEKIPAVAVVFNNGQWGAEKKNQIDYFDNRFVGTNLANPDFSEVARVMGAEGYRVEHEDEVSDALKAALKSGKPAVVEIMLTQELGEPFRRDAFRPPHRLLPKYRRFSARQYR